MVDISYINTFAVIGAGTMGHEIAQVALMAGFKKVILNDLVKEVIDNAAKKIESNLKKLETKGIEFHRSQKIVDVGPTLVATIKDIEGNWIQFSQRK